MPRLAGAVGASVLLALTVASYGIRITAAPLPLPVFPVLTILFITSGAVIVAYVAARAYINEGLPSMLFVGSGSLVFGSTSLVAALMAGDSGSNAATTIFIGGALASSILHVACGASRFVRSEEHEGSLPVVISTTSLSLVLAGLLAVAAVDGWFPKFFVPAVGTTATAKEVLVIAIVAYGLASLLIAVSYSSAVLYWYSWALAVTALGLFGLLLSDWIFQEVVFWVGRIGLCVGGAFLVLSVLAAERGSDAPGDAADGRGDP